MTSVKRMLLGFCVLAALTMPLSAAVMGTANIGQCAVAGESGVRVTATTIDWSPYGAGGCFAVGSSTMTYSTGAITSGETGTIMDLGPGNPPPVDPFITFDTDPIYMTLDGFEAGNGAIPGPFRLTQNNVGGNTSVTVELLVFGRAFDVNNDVSNWYGVFTTQITDERWNTIQEIQDTINAGGFVESTYSASLTATFNPIPEPGTYVLMGAGLVALGFARRRTAR